MCMAFYLTTLIIIVDQRYMPEMIPDYYYRKRGHIMGFTKKTWKNRIAEYINRRLLTMEDGSTNLVTVARDEGTISQEGDAFNAANMNNLEDRIEAGFEEINQSLTQSARVFMNENYGKNVSVLATKCDDRYIVSGIIQITNTTIGQDIFEINDNNKFITLKSRSDVMFINISTSKIYLAVGLPGGSGIEANTTAIPSGTYMIYGVIQ
nr:MAG TPA: hypothetical protein [Caudoviricetes sp.]